MKDVYCFLAGMAFALGHWVIGFLLIGLAGYSE